MSFKSKQTAAHLKPLALRKIRQRWAGLSLMELLCVIAIISILSALYLRVIVRAFRHVLHFLSGF